MIAVSDVVVYVVAFVVWTSDFVAAVTAAGGVEIDVTPEDVVEAGVAPFAFDAAWAIVGVVVLCGVHAFVVVIGDAAAVGVVQVSTAVAIAAPADGLDGVVVAEVAAVTELGAVALPVQ